VFCITEFALAVFGEIAIGHPSQAEAILRHGFDVNFLAVLLNYTNVWHDYLFGWLILAFAWWNNHRRG
jgi:hypothetical protein